MTIIETIRKRKSVRTYTSEPLGQTLRTELENSMGILNAPFGSKARISLITCAKNPSERLKLGTYGFIQGATDFLALIYEEGHLAEVGAAYMFEQAILHCTAMGLGTCWLGGSFSRKDFKSQVNLSPNERLRIVSPVGFSSEKVRLVEKIIGGERHHASRKPFGKLFFLNNFNSPLSESHAGKYALPLEMVRLAPSANNTQSWRVILNDSRLHFYKSFSYGFSSIDAGIALCHFEQTCIELGIKGRYEELPEVPQNKGNYIISWIGE
ncbi:MAG: hypothetical protein LBH04_11310 [Tannerellaceae bacterium]|jgi:nitroreductase|nr:hypothetical protein [Tannerellaceae bacterium]